MEWDDRNKGLHLKEFSKGSKYLVFDGAGLARVPRNLVLFCKLNTPNTRGSCFLHRVNGLKEHQRQITQLSTHLSPLVVLLSSERFSQRTREMDLCDLKTQARVMSRRAAKYGVVVAPGNRRRSYKYMWWCRN